MCSNQPYLIEFSAFVPQSYHLRTISLHICAQFVTTYMFYGLKFCSVRVKHLTFCNSGGNTRVFMCEDLAPIDHLLEATVQTFIFPSQVLNKIFLLGLDPLSTLTSISLQHTKICNSMQAIA